MGGSNSGKTIVQTESWQRVLIVFHVVIKKHFVRWIRGQAISDVRRRIDVDFMASISNFFHDSLIQMQVNGCLNLQRSIEKLKISFNVMNDFWLNWEDDMDMNNLGIAYFSVDFKTEKSSFHRKTLIIRYLMFGLMQAKYRNGELSKLEIIEKLIEAIKVLDKGKTDFDYSMQ